MAGLFGAPRKVEQKGIILKTYREDMSGKTGLVTPRSQRCAVTQYALPSPLKNANRGQTGINLLHGRLGQVS